MNQCAVVMRISAPYLFADMLLDGLQARQVDTHDLRFRHYAYECKCMADRLSVVKLH
jgi:hypothetical protein